VSVAEETVDYQEPSAVADVHATVAPEPVTAEHAASVGYVGIRKCTLMSVPCRFAGRVCR